MRQGLLALVVTGAFVFAAPALASATTFCVSPGGTGFAGCTGTPKTTIMAAINASGSGDTIEIGPGTYDEKPSDPFGKPLTIIGSGEAQTIIHPSATASGAGPAVTVGDPGTRLSDLTVAVEAGSGNYGIQSAGPLTRVAITADSTAPGATGVYMANGTASLTDSAITVTSSGAGVVFGIPRATISNVRITARQGIDIDTLVNGTITVDDVLCVTPPGTGPAYAVRAVADGAIGSTGLAVTIRHLTAIGDGSTNSAGVAAAAQTAGSGGALTNVALRSSIIRGFHHAISNDAESASPSNATSNVAVDYSDFDSSTDMNSVSPGSAGGSASGAITPGSHSFNMDPLFVSTPGSAAPDPAAYHLAAGSPAIDTGDPAPPAAGEPVTDLAGAPRAQTGRSGDPPIADMGAFEFTPHGPSAVAAASPATVAFGSTATFSAAGSATPDPGDSLTYEWRFDDGEVANGPVVSHSFATAGHHSGTLTVTDLDGFSATAAATVTVLTPSPGTDSKLKIRPHSLKPATSGGAADAARARPGAVVSYVDSKAESTRFTIKRAVPGIHRGRSCERAPRHRVSGRKHRRCTAWVKIGGFTRSDRAGANRFRFTGRVNHRKLRPGSYRLEAQTILDGVRGAATYVTFKVL